LELDFRYARGAVRLADRDTEGELSGADEVTAVNTAVGVFPILETKRRSSRASARPGLLCLLVLALMSILGPMEAARAEGEDEATLRSRIAAEDLAKVQSQGRLAGLRRVEAVLDRLVLAPPSGEAPSRFGATREVWDAIAAKAGEDQTKRLEALTKIAETMGTHRQEALEAWKQVESETSQPAGTSAANSSSHQFLARPTYLIVAWGMFAFSVSMLLTAHQGRTRIRRRLRSMGASIVLVAVGLSLLASGCRRTEQADDDAQAAETSAREKLLTDLNSRLNLAKKDARKIGREADEAEKKVQEKQEEVTRGRLQALLPLDPPERLEELARKEAQTQEKLRRAIVDAAVTVALVGDTNHRLETLTKVESDRRMAVAKERQGELVVAGARIGLCLVLFVFTLLPFVRVRRQQQKVQDLQANQCPRCLETVQFGELAFDVTTQQGETIKLVECPSCQYQFDDVYRHLPRVAFPTVGILDSGKTRGMITAYERIRNGLLPIRSVLTPMPAQDSAAFDQMIKDHLEQHQHTESTKTDLPSPLIFYYKDEDRLGPSGVLTFLFDYSGEIMVRWLDAVRRRVLLFDGFILFLDPTQVRSSQSRTGYGIDDQIQALLRFKAEMKRVRGITDPAARLEVPIAVCVSKLDRLVVSSEMGSAAESWLRELRKSVSGRATLELIQARSDYLTQALPLIFPGWNVERMLRDEFGNRVMFFPMSPVGIEEEHIRAIDLTHTVRAPFGVLEPLLWLLHMQGYCVFR
jgi:hypothetical protein